MTTEATFQAALDADPTDWQTRLVFADWLMEHGDMRWEGMLWLGMERKWPEYGIGWDFWPERFAAIASRHCLIPFAEETMRRLGLWTTYKTRADAENAFCRAYPALAAAHPAEFAVGVMA